ncbi:uncharacterized protein LOC119525005 [Choloepus didactylus]|uniref:uncharacterized protein LOC119525005 n=1 Tax=Choloepus didactylus TaxID=27675 RepID=UPI0018A06D63|nr:uncharacterized protein LOC119525005 [Choloepus didactylus]
MLAPQKQLMVAVTSDQEDEETLPNEEMPPGASENETPECLLEEPHGDTADEDIPSNSMVGSELSENAPTKGLLKELLQATAVEEAPYYSEVARIINPNDWLAYRRYSSSDEDDNPGERITVTALVHSEAFFTDSEDSDGEDNFHLSTVCQEEENINEKQEENEEEKNISITELTGVAAIEQERGTGDKTWMVKISADTTPENDNNGEMETSV